jgi:hypothetical protein
MLILFICLSYSLDISVKNLRLYFSVSISGCYSNVVASRCALKSFANEYRWVKQSEATNVSLCTSDHFDWWTNQLFIYLIKSIYSTDGNERTNNNGAIKWKTMWKRTNVSWWNSTSQSNENNREWTVRRELWTTVRTRSIVNAEQHGRTMRRCSLLSEQKWDNGKEQSRMDWPNIDVQRDNAMNDVHYLFDNGKQSKSRWKEKLTMNSKRIDQWLFEIISEVRCSSTKRMTND